MVRGPASILVWALIGTLAAQSASDEYGKRRRKMLLEAGQRRLQLGSWARDEGLTAQATREFLAAVEVSENQHPGAHKVLGIMQRLDDRFWKNEKKNPSKKLLDTYEMRSEKLDSEDQKDRLELASFAERKKLDDEAMNEYMALVRAEDKELEFEADGRLKLRHGFVPKAFAERIKKDAVTINQKLWLRDEFLALLPEIKVVHECATKTLRVRSTASLEEAEKFHAIGSALLPHLSDEVGGRPLKSVNAFIFAKRSDYEGALTAMKLADHADAEGIATPGFNYAIFAREGKSEIDAYGVFLHEIAHLFDFSVSRAVMPSWNREAFAETFGGQGTFTWDGKVFTTRGKMTAARIAPVKSDQGFIPLAELVAANALDLIKSDKVKATTFYAESWAFRRYMIEGASADDRQKYRAWEKACRGAALGAEAGKLDSKNEKPAADSFVAAFGADLARIEIGFKEYVKNL